MRGEFSDLVGGHPLNGRDLLGDQPDMGGLVALAAMRRRCQIRAVGLHKDAVHGDGFHDVPEHRRVLKGDHAREGEGGGEARPLGGRPRL